MKMRSLVFLFFAVFAGSFFLASCLNDDNKIPDNCYDGVLNNGEINIDCGGPNCEECDHCTNGVWEPERGETWLDCGGECPVCPTCANGVQDGDEIGIDCGGVCGGCVGGQAGGGDRAVAGVAAVCGVFCIEVGGAVAEQARGSSGLRDACVSRVDPGHAEPEPSVQ